MVTLASLSHLISISGTFESPSHRVAKPTDCTAVGSQMEGINPFTKRGLEAFLPYYCPKLANQSSEKWLPHTDKVVGRAAK